ncbi:class F sortase [Paenibacillus paridis]|uniref:class F sortase n=1 Tax=Paenibacillus paridis TaxID=2583376 RepID=UPI00111EA90C|nr:class F sortase [Paenibacillus paridis]
MMNRMKIWFFLVMVGMIAMALTLTSCSKEVSPAVNDAQTAASSPSPTPTKSVLQTPSQLKEEDLGIVPVSISIPAIGVDAAIEEVGTMKNGQMGVPQNIDGVGWFEPGTKPGERGNAVMAGHVDSLTGPAVFYKLDRLKAGDEVVLKDKDGVTRAFIVTGTASYPRKDAPLENIFGFSYQRHLNLITCTGEFNKEAKTHEERLVVFTELQK